MRLATFQAGGTERIGVVDGDEIVDLSAAAPELPRTMPAFLAAGTGALMAAATATRRAPRLALDRSHLRAPVPAPRKFLAAGLNYAQHIAEMDRERPDFPTIFNKQVTCVNGPYAPIQIPAVSNDVDYEGELGVVIGRRCRNVPRERAAEVIAGYVVVNDVSVRDWQTRSPTLTLGKSFDTHGPFGPWIVTADELPDPQALSLRTWVNDELRQDANTREMIFSCVELVATLSTACTLEPGDVISTGTPSGVGMGFDPPRFLQAGDTVRIEIEDVGMIENPVVAPSTNSGNGDVSGDGGDSEASG